VLSLDRSGVVWGLAAVAVAVALVVLGSSGLSWFDAALVGYLFGTLFAIFGTVYRYRVWLQRPPTRRLNQRGWEALLERGHRTGNFSSLPMRATERLILQGFIRRRSFTRWVAHQLLFWGCVLAALVTFPLVFGWLHFESVGQQAREYRLVIANLDTFVTFDSRGVFGWFVIHALDVSAVLVLAGVFIFLARRLRDPGELVLERAGDFLPLAGLFAVSVTGLLLTASNLWLEGRFYTFLTTTHALTVILGLMYIPFGKLFHIFQRPGNLGVAYVKAADTPRAVCRECGEERSASERQVEDLKEILPELGFDYRTDDGHYQDTCPRCRRRLVTLTQSRRVGGFG
jgi:nitrate reductase gamma subunit